MRLNQLSSGMSPTDVIRALGLALSVVVFSTAALSSTRRTRAVRRSTLYHARVPSSPLSTRLFEV